MTHRYIGTKEVVAWPAEKDGAEGYGVKYADGYISWSPKAAFDEAYRTSEPGMEQALNFGDALHYLKLGKKVARAGWNGKGMWLIMVPGTIDAKLNDGTPYQRALDSNICEILPHIDMWTVNAKGRRAMLQGWMASQTDMLSEDWLVL